MLVLILRTAAVLPVPQAHHELQKYTAHGTHVDGYSREAAAKAYDNLITHTPLVAFVDPR